MENKILRRKQNKRFNEREKLKDGRTPFGNWAFREGIGEGWYTKSQTMSSLFSCEMLFNSTTCDCISS